MNIIQRQLEKSRKRQQQCIKKNENNQCQRQYGNHQTNNQIYESKERGKEQ